MVPAEAMQKDQWPAGANALVVKREFTDLESAGGDSIFHVVALVARKDLILPTVRASQTMKRENLEAGETQRLDHIAIKV